MIPLQATYGGIVLYNDAKINYYIVILTILKPIK
jgi:hypothetical protein